MRPPCELVVRYMLPAFRSLVARELVETHHLTQMDVADRLGTTQAAVSYYICAKRGDKIMKQLESVPSIRKAAREVAEGIANQRFSFTDALSKFCELCKGLRKKDVICDLHHNYTTLPEACNICPEVALR